MANMFQDALDELNEEKVWREYVTDETELAIHEALRMALKQTRITDAREIVTDPDILYQLSRLFRMGYLVSVHDVPESHKGTEYVT